MSEIIQFPTDNEGEFIYVEVDDLPALDKGLINASNDDEGDSGIKKAATKFEKALVPIKRISASVITKIRELADSPSEVSVEIGLKFNAEAGVIITKASTEANLKILLTWKKASPIA